MVLNLGGGGSGEPRELLIYSNGIDDVAPKRVKLFYTQSGSDKSVDLSTYNSSEYGYHSLPVDGLMTAMQWTFLLKVNCRQAFGDDIYIYVNKKGTDSIGLWVSDGQAYQDWS